MRPRAEALLLAVLWCCACAADLKGYQLNNEWEKNTVNNKSDIYAETPDILSKHGYPLETHVITTDDGYILRVHRIPHGRDVSRGARVRAPVLVMHGLFSASDLWLLTGPDKGLGFILADAGYDVWLGNARGNYYSRKHVTLKPSDPNFWEFSWHEMGTRDLPAVIDYMIDTTHTSQIYYIGFSMGCTMFFALTSTLPQYNAKVKLMVGLAPVALNGKLRTPFGELFLPYSRNILEGFYRSGQLEMLPRIAANSQVAEIVCPRALIGQALCMALYFSLYGTDPKQLNKTMLPVYWSHMLSGTSANTVSHYVENNKAGRFQLYDQTRQRRQMPLYNLSQISTPVSMHYALNDYLLNPAAVLWLYKQLPNVVQLVRLKEKSASHIDLVLAIESKSLVFNEVLRIMNKYN